MYTPFAKKSPKLFCPFQLMILNPLGALSFSTENIFFPPKEYCPLCPGKGLNFPTEIPFKNFEVAVFPNRWPSFASSGKKTHINNLSTKASKGECEVIVYSSKHSATLAEMSDEQVKLLIQVWIDRYNELQKNPDVKYVLPFENRGEECE